MPLSSLNLSNLQVNIKKISLSNLFVHCLFLITANFFLAYFLLKPWWIGHFDVFHALLESICAFIAFSTYLLAWHTYEENPTINAPITFGFLIIGFLQFLHIYYSLTGHSYISPYHPTAIIYQIPSRCLESLVILWCTYDKPKINKWWGLIWSALLCLSLLAIFNYYSAPTYSFIFSTRIASQIFAIIILCLALYRLRNKLNSQYPLMYKYIYLASLLTIVLEVNLSILNPFYHLLAHLLRLTAFYYLFKGVFVNSITYPYQSLERVSRYTVNILNDLPLGLITYDNNLNLSFINQSGLKMLRCSLEDIKGLHFEEISKQFFANESLVLNVNKHQLEDKSYLCLFTEASKEQDINNLQLQTQTILNSINAAVLILDQEKRIVLCNKTLEKMVEMEAKDFLGMNSKDFERLINFSIKNPDKLNSDSCINNGLVECSLITPTGETIQLLCHRSPIRNVNREIIGYIDAGYDITMFNKEQHKVVQQEKLASLGQMAAGIVHEIRNPLTTIKGFIQLIQAKSQEEKIKEYAAVIEKEVYDMNKLVTDFLTFAKPHPPILKKVSLNRLIESMQTMLEANSFLKRADLTFIFTLKERLVLADPNQLKQVLLNMVENALDATNTLSNPEITIQTGWNNPTQEMVIVVKDNGIGMKSNEKVKLGTPFFTTKDKGTGLGLSICFQIVKEHGGRILIESEEGQGTTFNIYLPIVEQG